MIAARLVCLGTLRSWRFTWLRMQEMRSASAFDLDILETGSSDFSLGLMLTCDVGGGRELIPAWPAQAMTVTSMSPLHSSRSHDFLPLAVL